MPANREDDEFSIFRPPRTAKEQEEDNKDANAAGSSSQHGQGEVATKESAAQQPEHSQGIQADASQAPEASAAEAQQVEEALSPEQEAEMLAKAEALKAEGNELYGKEQYEEAADKYEAALQAAPSTKGAAKQRAIYLANLAACDLGLKQYSEAVQACTAAVEEDPTYIKAYMRRSAAFEQLQDLDHALADARKVKEVDGTNSWAAGTIKRLEPVVTAKNEKLKEEMMGKLKDLGNTILGKFGMSLDNFKAEKDPHTGGYSIRFQQ